jgi:hypothetical protein
VSVGTIGWKGTFFFFGTTTIYGRSNSTALKLVIAKRDAKLDSFAFHTLGF